MASREVMRIGLVGCGQAGQAHIKAWHNLHGVSIGAVCDIEAPRAKETARSWGIPASYTDLIEMLNGESMALVDICTPPQTHCQLILQALDSGCHVVVEKPLTMTTEEAKAIIRAQKGSNVTVNVIHNWLFSPAMIKALALIRREGIGKIMLADISVLCTPNKRMLQDPNHWSHSLPGAPFADILAHPIYTLQAILGKLRLYSVQTAKLGSCPWIRRDELQASLGAHGGFASIHLSFNSKREDILLRIFGTEGILEVVPSGNTVIYLGGMGSTSLGRAWDNFKHGCQYLTAPVRGAPGMFPATWGKTHEIYLRTCIARIRRNEEPSVPLSQAYTVVETLEQICNKVDSMADSQHI